MKFVAERTQRILGIELLGETFLSGKSHRTREQRSEDRSQMSRHLHELDSCTIGIANIDNALACVRTGFESLRFAGGFPTGRGNFFKDGVETVDRECNVNRSDIA